MIVYGLDLDSATEALRISARGYLRISLKATADSAAIAQAEIMRAYGTVLVPYDIPLMLPLNGESIIDLDVDDCPEIAIVITTPDSGSFDVEWALGTKVQDSMVESRLDLSVPGMVWESGPLRDYERKTTIVVSPGDEVTTAAIKLQHSINFAGQPVSGSSIPIDDSVFTEQIGPRSSIGILCTDGQTDLQAVAWVYQIDIDNTI